MLIHRPISDGVRPHPTHQRVFASILQMPEQGEAIAVIRQRMCALRSSGKRDHMAAGATITASPAHVNLSVAQLDIEQEAEAIVCGAVGQSSSAIAGE